MFEKLIHAINERLLRNGKKPVLPSKKKCVWALPGECSKDLHEARMFGLLKVPICGAHLEYHAAIIALYNAGKDLNNILYNMSRAECLKMAKDLPKDKI
jgi:hypothetical protein